MRFLKITLIGAVTFVLPLALIGALIAIAVQFALRLLMPIEHVLPRATVLGVSAPHFTAALVVLLVCYLAGVLATTGTGQRLRDWFERQAATKLPGYSMVRTLLAGVIPSDKPVEVALVEMENMRVMAFVMERHANGCATIFVPSAPTPTVGTLFIARADQVQRVDVRLKDAMMCISRLGVGAERLLAGMKQADSG